MALTKVKGSVLPDIFPGVIWMFAGTESQIADGWQLCNGEGETSNGIDVPDLRDRMIICAGEDYDLGDTGGSETETTNSEGSHSHSVTVNSGGSHSHSISVENTTLSNSQVPVHKHTSPLRGRSDDPGSWEDINGVTDASDGFASSRTTGTYTNIIFPYVDDSGGSSPHNHTASSNSTGSHTHTASSSSTGSHTHTVSTLSPYYALAFIIKL